jgi:hypothetical protein
MKKHFLLLLIITCNLVQAQVKEVIVSKPFNVTEVDLYWKNEQEIISVNDSFVFVICRINNSKMLNLKPTNYTLVKYDAKTLEKISEIELPFTLDYIFHDSVAYSYRFIVGTGNYCFSRYDFRTQDTLSTEPPFEEHIKGQVFMTEDSTAFCAVKYLRNDEGKVEMTYKIIGLDFTTKFERSFSIPFFVKKYMEESFYIDDFEIDKDYNLYFSLKVQNPKERGYNDPDHYEVIKYNQADEKITRYEADLGSELYSNCTNFYINEQTNKINFWGTYSVSYGDCVNGVYLMEFDINSGNRTAYKTIKFTQELFESVKITKLTKSKDNDICYLGCPNQIKFSKKENGYLLAFSLQWDYSDRMGKVLLSLDEKGNTEWSAFQYFEQNQAHLKWGQLYSGVRAVSEDNIYIFYNDRTTKSRNSEYQKFVKSKVFDTHIPFIAKVNKQNGKIQNFPLLPLADQSMKIHGKSVKVFSDKVLYAVASKKLEHVIVKIILE